VLGWETDRLSGTSREPASVPDFVHLRARNRTFSALAAFMAATSCWLRSVSLPG
jgi:hypothetical protein